jgi:hypothetical protein
MLKIVILPDFPGIKAFLFSITSEALGTYSTFIQHLLYTAPLGEAQTSVQNLEGQETRRGTFL